MKKKNIIIAAVLFLVAVLAGYIVYQNYAYRESGIVKDSHGMELMCKNLIVGFNKSASQESINSAINLVHGQIKMDIPEINGYIILIPGRCDAKTVMDAISAMSKSPDVEYAEPNFIEHINTN